MAGKIVHFEVPANDTGRALNFYNELFGWSFQEMKGPVEYHMTQVSENMGAGVHRADQGGGIPGIFVYFDVDDINEGAQRVRDLGGTAEEPGPIPQMGWYARCSDTEGNPFGLWQSDPNAPAPEGAA
jgi:predicted enzyme related to lactoylglutathione lyase